MSVWLKKGMIFFPQQNDYWNQSHAQLPIVEVISEQVWRIYYSTRDKENHSRFSYIEVESGKPEQLLSRSDQPILQLGELGTFDESGQMCVSIVNHQGVKYLYYAGWSEKKQVPYHNAIGLAISTDDGKTFTKYSSGPLLDSKPFEPFFTGTACVRIENEIWRMWYQSCTQWKIINGKPQPFYHIKYAESDNGIDWHRKGTIAIDYKEPSEAGICSATVIQQDQIYKMWFSYRNATRSYRIGYAESKDGISWQRNDQLAGIELSPGGWDAEMLAYPNVVLINNKKFMFYNGNGFGQSGFGYAIQE